jgi:hypothetical protein
MRPTSGFAVRRICAASSIDQAFTASRCVRMAKPEPRIPATVRTMRGPCFCSRASRAERLSGHAVGPATACVPREYRLVPRNLYARDERSSYRSEGFQSQRGSFCRSLDPEGTLSRALRIEGSRDILCVRYFKMACFVHPLPRDFARPTVHPSCSNPSCRGWIDVPPPAQCAAALRDAKEIV